MCGRKKGREEEGKECGGREGIGRKGVEGGDREGGDGGRGRQNNFSPGIASTRYRLWVGTKQCPVG